MASWIGSNASWLVPAAASLAGGLLGNRSQEQQQNQNVDFQREFAQHGVRWRVADARAAGIHPIHALGASGAQFSPISVGDPLGSAVGQMGQDIGRAFLQSKDQQGRNDELGQFMQQKVYQQELRDMQRQEFDQRMAMGNLQLEQERLRLFRLQQQTGPSVPSGIGSVTVKPSEQISAEPGYPGSEAARTPGMKRYGVGFGDWELPNSDVSEALEGMGVAGHAMTPFMLWENARARAMKDRAELYEKRPPLGAGPPQRGYYWHFVPDAHGGHWEERRKTGYGFDDRTHVRPRGSQLPDSYPLSGFRGH